MSSLILGSTGQLGTALAGLLPDARRASRSEADFAHPHSLSAFVRAQKATIVFNCAAYNAVDRAESEPELAYTVNALAVRELATACRELGAALVHISTNYVFGQDAARRAPYGEADLPGPVSAYGVSKLAGEYFALAYCPRAVVIRTAAVFGRVASDRPAASFIDKVIARARHGEMLRVVNDQTCTPTAAADLAQAAVHLVQAAATGLYHFTNAGACAWHELAETGLHLAGIDAKVEAVSSDAFAAPARRPEYSVLACERYDAHGFGPRRSWQEALREYVSRCP